MAVNRVDFGGNTLIDLTGDTLELPEQLLKGILAHAKDGTPIEGTLEAGGGGGADISPFSSIKCGSFNVLTGKTLTIDGVSGCKIFAFRALNDSSYGGIFHTTNYITSAVLVNTETWKGYMGASTYFNSRSESPTYVAYLSPTVSGDTLTFNYSLYGDYEYVMVS